MLNDVEAVKRSLASGAAWMIGMRFANRLLGLLSTVVLARLLTPEDFGLVAMAMLVVGSLEIFGELSFDLNLIHNQKAERHHYDTVWTLTLIRGVLTALMLCLLAAPMAEFFEEPRLTDVIYVLSLASLVEGFINVGVVDFRKNLNFDKEFLFMFLSNLVRVITTIILAWWWGNYWTLVAGIILGTVLKVLLSYWMHDFRPRLGFRDTRRIMGFSGWLLLSNLLGFIYRRGAYFAIGRMATSSGLGLFTVAHELATLASTELIAPLNRATLPVFAKLSHDLKQLKETFLDLAAYIIVLTLPTAAGIGVTAELLVKVILGQQWLEAIPLMQILCIVGLVEAARSQTRTVFIATGHPHLGAFSSGLMVILYIPALLWCIQQDSIPAAAWSMVAAATLMLVIDLVILQIKLSIRVMELIARLWRAVLATAVMAPLVYWTMLALEPTANLPLNIVKLLLCTAVGVLVYGAVLLSLWALGGRPRGAEAKVMELLTRTRLKLTRARA